MILGVSFLFDNRFLMLLEDWGYGIIACIFYNGRFPTFCGGLSPNPHLYGPSIQNQGYGYKGSKPREHMVPPR